MFNFYIKSAARSINGKKLFSVLSITGLAIGLCIFMLSLEYYSYETAFNSFHKNAASLYRVNMISAEGISSGTVPNLAPMLKNNVPGIKAVTRFTENFSTGSIVSYQPGTDASSL